VCAAGFGAAEAPVDVLNTAGMAGRGVGVGICRAQIRETTSAGTCSLINRSAICQPTQDGVLAPMNLLADSWYASGLFLGVAGIVVTFVAGAIGVWAAFRAADLRQVVTFEVQTIAPFLTEAARDACGDVELHLDGKILNEPQVLDIRVANRSRRDIASSDFDQGRVLRLDVAVPVIKLLRFTSVPAEFRPPRVEIDGTALVLGPDLIKRGQSFVFSLLVDGSTPCITFPETPLLNISIRRLEAGVPGGSLKRRRTLVPITLALGLAVGVLLTLGTTAGGYLMMNAGASMGAHQLANRMVERRQCACMCGCEGYLP
jgi:uncharacterized membrane protein